MNKMVLIGFIGMVLSSCTKNQSATVEQENDALSNLSVVEKEERKNTLILEPQKFVQWTQSETNGLKKEKTIDDVTFSVQYKPYEYIVCMEEKKNQLADSLVKKKISELDEMQYYDLKIALNSAQGEILKYNLASAYEYDQRVKYFAFEMQNDIKLVEGDDTLSCGLFHFERTYDIAPFSKFLLGFSSSKNKSSNEKTLIFYDRTFHKGIIKFTFTKKELKNIPKLKTI